MMIQNGIQMLLHLSVEIKKFNNKLFSMLLLGGSTLVKQMKLSLLLIMVIKEWFDVQRQKKRKNKVMIFFCFRLSITFRFPKTPKQMVKEIFYLSF